MTKGSILFINRVFPSDSGASGLRLMELCQGLAEKNWSVSVLTNKGRGSVPPNLHPNIKVIRLPWGTAEKTTGLKALIWLKLLAWRAVFLPRADITVTLTDPPMAATITAWLKLVKRTHAVHWVHDQYPDLFTAMGYRLPFLLPILTAVSTCALKMHDRLVAIGDDMKQVLLAKNIPAEKITVIPNWPDVTSALMDKKKPTRTESQNPFILENTFTVLYSGNFGLVHDFDAYLDAIKIVQQSGHPIRFIMAGDGPRFSDVRRRVEDMILTNVHFVRAQPKDKFMEMLLAGDLHVATIVPEALGLAAPSKINSSLGLGRPCLYIGSKKSSQAELITKYNAGKVIDITDPQAKFQIADAIIHYATDRDAYTAAQASALEAAESISFEKSLNAFDTLFTTMLAAR